MTREPLPRRIGPLKARHGSQYMHTIFPAARPSELPGRSGVDCHVPSFRAGKEKGVGGMLKILLFPAVIAGLLYADPVAAMESFIDAVYRCDAETVFGMLSDENRASITLTLAMSKLQPVSAAERLSLRIGNPVNGGELSRWTEADFVKAVLEAPILSTVLPPRNTITCSVSEMKGDTAVVACRAALPSGGEGETRFALVMQGGVWRVGEPFL